LLFWSWTVALRSIRKLVFTLHNGRICMQVSYDISTVFENDTDRRCFGSADFVHDSFPNWAWLGGTVIWLRRSVTLFTFFLWEGSCDLSVHLKWINSLVNYIEGNMCDLLLPHYSLCFNYFNFLYPILLYVSAILQKLPRSDSSSHIICRAYRRVSPLDFGDRTVEIRQALYVFWPTLFHWHHVTGLFQGGLYKFRCCT
jgi:hypothetical protein